MSLSRVTSRRLSRIAVVMLVMIAVLPIAPSASAVTTGALTLNGTSQYVTMGAAPGLGTSTFTLELWFRRTGTGTPTTTGTGGLANAIPLLTKGRGEAENSNVDMNYFLGIDSVSNKLVADFEEGAGQPSPGLNHPITGNTAVTSNVWHHAAVTYDGTTWQLYLDGVADGSLAVGRLPRSDSIQHAGIGSAMTSTGAAAGFFQGQVDEARIWNNARSLSQIQAGMTTEIGATPGLIGQWHMNEGTGITTADSSGSGVNGSLIATPTWTTGTTFTASASNALTLNGSTQYVSMGASPALRSSTYTLELWFRRTGAGVGIDTGAGGIASAIPLITKGRAEGETAAADVNYFFGIDATSGKLVADFEEAQTGANPSVNHPITGNTVVTSNVWHHAAATYDGTTWRLYLDGNADGSLAVGQPANIAVTSGTAIGSALRTDSSAGGFFQGQIDEARIWSSARSQADIQAAMNTEIGPTNGLLGLWHLNATSGTTAVDGAGNATVNNGTVVATPAWAPGMGQPFSATSGLQLNGTTQYVTMGASPGLRSPTFTAELWFRRTATGLGTSTGNGGVTAVPLITKGRADGETAAQDVNYFLGIDTVTGKLAADFEEAQTGATPGLNHPIVGNTVITSNVWHHAAVTYDGTTWRLYLDGAPDGSLAVGQPANAAVTSATAVGSALTNAGVADGFFAGQIDEARIWNVARSQGQIQSTINSEVGSAAGLVGSWHMSEGTGTVVADSSGGGINGATVATPVWTYGMLLGAAPTNLAPIVDSVSINQATPRTGDTLSATVASHDPDGDTLTTQYQWTKNGTDIPGATNATLNLATAGNGDKGDVIRVRVTASDASLTSTPVTSSPVTVLNTVPTASVSLDDHAPSTNATLTATATKADVDGDTVGLTYVWKVNGTTRQTTTTSSLTDTFDLSVAGNGNNGQTVSVTVTPNDGTADGSPVVDSATVGNAVPVVDSVTIDQTAPQTNDTLTATVVSHDADGDTMTTSYQWTLGGTDIAGETSATLDLSTVGNGDRGDLIRVRVTVSDGTATSGALTSSPVTVQNSAPSATVTLDDHTPGTNVTLTATATKVDIDGDAVSLTYVWKVDGATKQTTTTTSLTDTFDLSVAGNGDNGQTVSVTVTPADGTVDGDPEIDSATVGNAAPVVDSVTIDQTSPRTDDTLTATVVSHDADGDTLTTDYQWTLGGTDIAGETGSSLDLSTVGNGDRGDLIRVRVTVSDGTATSGALTSSPVSVQNTAPSATATLDDHSPATGATVTATATTADADGDAVGLTYVWKVDGTTKQTTTTAAVTDTFDLSVAGNGDNGQTVTVTVTPNDGTDDGSPVVDSANVGNAAPVVDSVVINQATPHTNDTLSATVTSHDPDGDTLTTNYQWTRNGNDIVGANAATLDLSLANHGDKGDLIRLRVSVSDGSATSSPLTSSAVTILNTAPVATVTLNDHTPGTNATLTATATATDADADAVTLTYVWRVNGTVRQTTPGAGLSDTFDLSLAGNGNKGQTVTVTATPTDGTTSGGAVVDTATVGNTAPVVDSVVINQATPRTNDTLSATVTSHDTDGDALVTSYQWTRNGTDIPGATGATLSLSPVGSGDKGDLIRVRVTVSDGTTPSGPLTSAPVTVLNTVPVATVSLSDHAPGTATTLTATATRSDADGDTVGLTYVWTVNGTTKRTTVTNALTDTFDLSVAGNGDANDVIVVTVTPNDGTTSGSPANDSATVSSGVTPPIFIDDFANLSAWTNTRLTIDNATGSPAAPSARAQTNSQSASAFAGFTPTATACSSLNVNLSAGSGVDVFRLRTAANGAIIKVVVLATGNLQLRSDFGTTTFNSGVQLGTGWHNVELCGTVGSNTTWSLYRDGVRIVNAWQADTGTTPIGRIQIGDTVAKTFTMNFDHVVVDQVVGEAQAPDVTAPTVPGKPAGTSPSNGTIQISWAASTDDTPPITYRVYRDGNPTPIGSTTSTTYTDPGLVASSVHTYAVDAVDSLTNASAKSAVSDPITVAASTAPLFSDDFASLGAWSGVTRIVLDNANGSPSAPSARAQVTNQSASAYHDLVTPTMNACTSMNVNRATAGAVDLFRLRTAANGAIIKVVVLATGNLQLRSDFASTTLNSGVALGNGWHNIELCGTVGSATTWDLYRDGVRIVNAWQANTGTVAIGRVQIGDVAAKTFTVNFDHVVMDQAPGENQGPDVTGPTTPGQPTGSSATSGTIQLSWAASTDATPPITYRIYRDGNPTSIGSTTATTFNDTGLTPGSIHTYTVDAIDGLTNPSAMSPVSAPITVSSGTPPIFSDDFTAGNFLNWTAFTRVTIDNGIGSPAAPSARASATAQSAFAYRDLASTTSTACMSVNVNVSSGNGFDLFRLRTAANGAIIKVVVTAAGTLQIRSDFASTTINSGIALGTGWHSVELCGTVGSATAWTLYRDGAPIVNNWVADTGTTPIGRIQIGDTAAKTFTANFDHVVLDQVVGG